MSAVTAAEVTTSVIGFAMLAAPVAIAERRNRRHKRDSAEHAEHMAYQEMLRQAGEDQKRDPLIAEVLRRYAELTPARRGVHRVAGVA